MTTPFSGGAGAADSQGSGAPPADVVGARVQHEGRKMKIGISRAKTAREGRRAAQFAKFRLTELNLVPLVDTFVSIVFFALTTAAVGELTPVAKGVTLPESASGGTAMRELTVAIGPQLTVAGRPVMSIQEAAASQSNNPAQPLLIPALYTALKASADSLRQATNTPADESLTTKLAVQGDKTMRYDMLSRVLMTARLAGFKNVSLQVQRTGADAEGGAPQQASIN